MKQPVTVELFYDAAWQNITGDVYARDDIQITHGRADAESNAQPSSCRLTLDNRSERYHPRNANSPLFGKIGRNTPLRVKAGASVRFTGEVASWKPDRTVRFLPNGVTGDAWVQVVANGVTRRLGQGATPLKSAPYRYATTVQAVSTNVPPVAYWPLDDLTRSDFGAPGLGSYRFKLRAGGSSAIKPGDGELAPWLPNGVKLEETPAGTVLDGIVVGPATQKVAVDVVQREDGAGVTSWAVYSNDGLTIWRVRFDPTINEISVLIRTNGSNSTETTIATATVAGAFDKQMHVIRLHLEDFGANVNYFVYVDGVNVISATRNSVNNAGCSKVRLIGTAASGSTSVAYGHVAVWLADVSHTPFEAADFAEAVFGHQGERAGRRIERLCSENSVAFASSGVLDDTYPLGPQHTDTLLDVLREAADTDLGILYETLDAVGLHYRCRANRYNLAAALTLNFAAAQVAPPLEPDVDDLGVSNDVTVTRRDGSSARATLSAGTLSTQAPPAGVGIYDEQVTVNPPSDGKFLEDQAGWRLHLGTVDEDRFPRVTVDLDANPELTAAVESLRVGDRLAVTSLPDHLSVDDLSLVVEGWSEVLGSHRRVVTFNCSPESPWRVAVYQSGAGSTVHKYDTGGSTLASGVTSTATSLSVATATGHPLWTADDAEDGFDAYIGGERVTVTDVSGSSSPQTFTVTRSVNGVVKAHSSGAAVRLWQTPILAL